MSKTKIIDLITFVSIITIFLASLFFYTSAKPKNNDSPLFADLSNQSDAKSKVTALAATNTADNMMGMNIDPFNVMPTTKDLTDLGVTWLRIEWRAGNGDYGEKLKTLKDAGFHILFIVDYSSTGQNSNPDPNAYAAKFEEGVKKWDKYIDAYEIWNEPDLQNEHYVSPSTLATMTKRAKDVLIKNQSKAKIITGGGLASGDVRYLQSLVSSLGNCNCYDAIAVHPYLQAPNGFSASWQVGRLTEFYSKYASAARGKPLWVTEIGTPDQSKQGDYLYRFYATTYGDKTNGADKIFWFAYSDQMVAGYGVNKSASGTPTSSYDDYQRAARDFGDLTDNPNPDPGPGPGPGPGPDPDPDPTPTIPGGGGNNCVGEITSPKDGAVIKSNTFNVTWKAGCNVSSYILQVYAHRPTGTQVETQVIPASASKNSLSVTLANATTEKRTVSLTLVSIFSNGKKDINLVSFTVDPSGVENPGGGNNNGTCKPVEITSPPNNSCILSKTAVFKWCQTPADCANVDRYTYDESGAYPATGAGSHYEVKHDGKPHEIEYQNFTLDGHRMSVKITTTQKDGQVCSKTHYYTIGGNCSTTPGPQPEPEPEPEPEPNPGDSEQCVIINRVAIAAMPVKTNTKSEPGPKLTVNINGVYQPQCSVSQLRNTKDFMEYQCKYNGGKITKLDVYCKNCYIKGRPVMNEVNNSSGHTADYYTSEEFRNTLGQARIMVVDYIKVNGKFIQAENKSSVKFYGISSTNDGEYVTDTGDAREIVSTPGFLSLNPSTASSDGVSYRYVPFKGAKMGAAPIKIPPDPVYRVDKKTGKVTRVSPGKNKPFACPEGQEPGVGDPNNPGSGDQGAENPDSPTPNPAACLEPTGTRYSMINMQGQTDRVRNAHADLNLRLRNYQWLSDKGLNKLADIPADANGVDGKAPQLSTIFGSGSPGKSPTITRAGQVNDWHWSDPPNAGTRGGPITAPYAVSIIGVKSKVGQEIKAPDSGYDIGQGMEASVLYAEQNRLTLNYSLDDSVATGYTVHYENICVDPNLLSAFNSASGRQLPALSGGQSIGRAKSDEVYVVIRDSGQFMDPRSRADWWVK